MALDPIIHRQSFTWCDRFQQAPAATLARSLYAYRQRLIAPRQHAGAILGIKVVCVSDTHNKQPTLPPGDVLIHAGDLTQIGTIEELQSQSDWLNAQPHPHKVAIAGNHDVALDVDKAPEFGRSAHDRESLSWHNTHYLERSKTTLNLTKGTPLTVYGHPATRKHGNWAFQYARGTDVFSGNIDVDVDILVTHSPPRFHLDVAGRGDQFLLEELWRVRPRLHVFGNVHEGRGTEVLIYDRFQRIYEQVCADRVGFVGVLQMVVLLAVMLFYGVGEESERTVLVNASSVGGTLDDRARPGQIVAL